MFADKNIAAIWCLQGGDNAISILDLIDYQMIKNNPKIFIGKSDIDLLSLVINKLTGLITFHGPDSKSGSDDKPELEGDYTKKWFVERLFNGSKQFEPSSIGSWKTIRFGQAEGKLIGCNMTTILKLAGTQYFPDFTGSIFFIETLDSMPRKLIPQINQLKFIGALDKLKGFVIGNNARYQPGPNNNSVEEIIFDMTKKYNLPILKINEFGHYQPHAFLPIGCRILLDATNKKIKITEEFISK